MAAASNNSPPDILEIESGNKMVSLYRILLGKFTIVVLLTCSLDFPQRRSLRLLITNASLTL